MKDMVSTGYREPLERIPRCLLEGPGRGVADAEHLENPQARHWPQNRRKWRASQGRRGGWL